MTPSTTTFEIIDEEITGVSSDYLVKCTKNDGKVITEWVTLPLESDPSTAKFSLVGPLESPRIISIKEKQQMASYIKFPLIFPASDWKAGKGIVIPVAGTKVFIQTKDNAPEWAADAFTNLDRFVKRKGPDAFIEVTISFDEDKGNVGERAVYLNLDSKTKPVEVDEEDYEDQGDLTDPEAFQDLLEAAGYSGKIASGGSTSRKPSKPSGGRAPRNTSGSSRPKRRQVEEDEDEDDEDEVEETPKKRVKTKVIKKIEPPKNALAEEELMKRMELLVTATVYLANELDIGAEAALNVANMNLCNQANGGRLDF